MFHTLLIVHLIITILLIVVVLLQKSTSGAWGGGSNVASGVMTARGTENFFTRATGVLAALFLGLSLLLAVLSKSDLKVKSIADGIVNTPPTKTMPAAPVVPSVPVAK